MIHEIYISATREDAPERGFNEIFGAFVPVSTAA